MSRIFLESSAAEAPIGHVGIEREAKTQSSSDPILPIFENEHLFRGNAAHPRAGPKCSAAVESSDVSLIASSSSESGEGIVLNADS